MMAYFVFAMAIDPSSIRLALSSVPATLSLLNKAVRLSVSWSRLVPVLISGGLSLRQSSCLVREQAYSVSTSLVIL